MVATSTYTNGFITHEYQYEVPEKKEVFLPCACGGEIVRLTKWEDEEETYLTVYSYVGDRYSFWERLRILFGGKVRIADVVLSKEEFNKLKSF